MKKYIFSTISIIAILCIVIISICVVNYVKTYNLLEDGIVCKNLSFKDTDSILKSFEVSNMDFVNTEYIYYKDTWREQYLVAKMVLPNGKTDVFEKNLSKNWVTASSLENQDSGLESFTNWWDIPVEENFIVLYRNECISERPTATCILAKYSKGNDAIYYLYTDIYKKNVLDIVIKNID